MALSNSLSSANFLVDQNSFMMRNLEPFVSRSSLLPIWVSGFGFGFCKSCEPKKRGNNNFRAVDRDSEFEIDPDKAREALQKLDQQLQFISEKQSKPIPKPKAPSPYKEEDVTDTVSFLPYIFFGLVIFTIVYNIVFIQVIKPSIDGPQVELSPVRPSLSINF